MSSVAVRLTSVTKRFQSGPELITILDRLDLEIHTGTSVVITGPSGSGKTTLLNIIGGLDSADEGLVNLEHTDLTHLDETGRAAVRAGMVGFVFQFHYLLKDFTAIENVMLPAYMRDGRKRRSLEMAESLLELVGLAERTGHYPHQLSGGERQRVAIARALINDPPVLLADEPTGNLDPDHAQGIEDLIFSTSERLGKTLVLVSHDLKLAARADRHLVLSRGELEQG